MELFTDNGHLTEQALQALVQEHDLTELERLEIAEHMAYCDHCLQRYTALLADVPLRSSEVSCQPTLWRHIRQRTIRVFTSRYAAAAAAVVLALTMLWSDVPCTIREQLPLPEELPPITERWSDSLDKFSSHFHTVFDRIDQLTHLNKEVIS